MLDPESPEAIAVDAAQSSLLAREFAAFGLVLALRIFTMEKIGAEK
jgi:hypothetical protein